jgi:glycine/D-amino acid oxidase-like deaminating enzyme
MARNFDVVIVGGGVMGCSVAYHLKSMVPALSVLVIERDPTYKRASSALSASSIRQHFSSPVNIRLSQESFSFLQAAASHLSVGSETAEIGLVERGYLYLAAPGPAEAALSASHAIQTACGARIALFDPADLRARFPWLSSDGIAVASFGLEGEGWFDGYSLLQGLRRKARSLGTEFLAAEVTGIRFAGDDAASVSLSDGTRVGCASLVNAAGPQAGEVGLLAGVRLPVRPERHCVFVFECPESVADCPLVVDPSGIYFRPESGRYIAGVPPRRDACEAADADLDVDHSLFDDVLWPTLAARVPAFEAIRCVGAWAGWYEMNTFDQNALIGAWPGRPNFYLINGFSGHGIQQSPAAGRALAELMVTGKSRTVDVSPLAPDRLLTGEPLIELNII